MSFYSLFVVLLFCCNAFGSAVNRRVIRQTGNTCTTPGNQPGTCIRLIDCPYLYDIIKNATQFQDPETKGFLQKSQCGKEKNGSPKVCCNLDPKNPPQIPSMTRLGPEPPSTGTTTGGSSNDIPVKDYSICGKSDTLKIVGGQNASLGDFPWMVAIGYRRAANPTVTWECGGSLIADRWVVTAGHCTQGIGSLTLTTVRIGDLNLDDTIKDGTAPVDIKVDKIIPHPQYQSGPIANDIALLRLKDPVTFNQFIRPICIPKATDEFKGDGFYFNKSPLIAGWGHTRGFQQSQATRSDHLLKAQVDIVELQVCDERYRTGQVRAAIDNRVLCASRPGIDSCQGDSGGPLMMPMKNSYALAGIVSFGVGCANERFPGVYTRVAVFSDWIRTTTGLKL